MADADNVPVRFATWLVVPLALLAVWWALTDSALGGKAFVNPVLLPSPLDTFLAAIHFVGDGTGIRDFAATAGRSLLALALAVVLGVPMGLLLGYSRLCMALLEPWVHALRSIPGAALFPLLLIVIGVGETSIVLLATYNAALVVLVSTAAGVRLANPSRLYLAELVGVRGFRLIHSVLFWETLPNVFAGIRVASGYTLALVVAVEMFVGLSENGLGRRIYELQAAYRIPETYAVILLTCLVGIAMNLILHVLERRMLKWHPNLVKG